MSTDNILSGQIKAIRIRLWFAGVRDRSGAPSAYALEREFSSEKFKKGPDGEVVRPCKWDKYARGESMPGPALLEQVEKAFPSTRAWLDLPLWEVVSEVPPPRAELHKLIAFSRPNLAARLQPVGTKKNSYRIWNSSTIDSLWKQGDVNALTTLLAIVRDAEQSGNDDQHAEAAVAAMQVFFLLATRQPFHFVRLELFDFLRDRFFSRTYREGITLRAHLVDIDIATSTLGRAIDLGISLGLISDRDDQKARLNYWMWREGLFDNGIAFLGQLRDTANNNEYLRDFTISLRECLAAEERRNPRRKASYLEMENITGSWREEMLTAAKLDADRILPIKGTFTFPYV